MAKITAKSIKLVAGFSIHIFSRKQTGTHDNKYVKVVKNGTVFAKYLLVKEEWESLSNAVPKTVITWVLENVTFILLEIDKLD